MDRRSSRDSSSPSARKTQEKPPFKLCFSKDRLPGKSTISLSKIDGDSIPPKFYSREQANGDGNDPDISDALEEIARQQKTSPKDAYRWPLLTSHTYGWWHGRGIQPKEPRLDFHKRTTDLVNFQMKIYSEDRKLKGLKQ